MSGSLGTLLASGIATFVGNVMTVSGSSGTWAVGQVVTGLGMVPNSIIASLGTGTGGNGSYNLSAAQTVSGQIAVVATSPPSTIADLPAAISTSPTDIVPIVQSDGVTRRTTLASVGAGGGLLPANNLSDLANIPAARSNLGLGNAATANVGTGTGQVASGPALASLQAQVAALPAAPSVSAGLAAGGQAGTGITQGAATLLAVGYNIVTAVAVPGAALIFPVVTVNSPVYILNRTTTEATVFPSTNGQIEGLGANLAAGVSPNPQGGSVGYLVQPNGQASQL